MTNPPLPENQVIEFQDLNDLHEQLLKREIIHVLIEPGPRLSQFFLEHSLIDELSLFINPSIIGSGQKAFGQFAITNLNTRSKFKINEFNTQGDDLYLSLSP